MKTPWNTQTVAATALVTIVSATMIGCSAYSPPSFEAVGVRELERTDTHTVIEFTIEATNPNKDPMPLGLASYTLTLDGEPVFSGVRSPQATVHTYSTHRFDLPAIIPTEQMIAAGEVSYALTGIVIYKQPGALADVLFDSEVIVPEAVLDLSGSIDLGR